MAGRTSTGHLGRCYNDYVIYTMVDGIHFLGIRHHGPGSAKNVKAYLEELEADIILLDEPFVGIDSVSEDIIMNTLRELRDKGKLILIVHHDLSKVPHYFDQVILLNRKLIASGPTNLIFNEDNLRKTYGNSLFYKGDVNDF